MMRQGNECECDDHEFELDYNHRCNRAMSTEKLALIISLLIPFKLKYSSLK